MSHHKITVARIVSAAVIVVLFLSAVVYTYAEYVRE